VLTEWKRDTGRPSQITAEKVAAIIQGVRAGMSYHGAAKRIGVYHQVAYYWKSKGIALDLDDDLDFDRLTDAERLYILLARGVTRAEGEFEAEQIQLFLEEAEGDWRARGWLLERTFPESYSLKQHLRVDMQVSVPAAPIDPPVINVIPIEERLRSWFELAREEGIDPEEQPSNQPDCAKVDHRLGAAMHCIDCGEHVASHSALAAPPPAAAAPRWRIIDGDGRVQES
jgi:hypothetical protein